MSWDSFASWSDGAQQHTILVPAAAQTYTATYNATAAATPAFVQVNAATPQTNQSTVTTTYANAQVAGDTNILAIGWNNKTSNITSVNDSAGNLYQLAVPTARGSGLSQAIYYATNIKAAAAGTNTVTVTFSASTPFVDIRALEYRGLDPVNPSISTVRFPENKSLRARPVSLGRYAVAQSMTGPYWVHTQKPAHVPQSVRPCTHKSKSSTVPTPGGP